MDQNQGHEITEEKAAAEKKDWQQATVDFVKFLLEWNMKKYGKKGEILK